MAPDNEGERDPRVSKERVSPWDSDAPYLLNRMSSQRESAWLADNRRREQRRRRKRIIRYAILIPLLGVATYVVGPPVVSWMQDLFGGVGSMRVSADCARAFSDAVETEAGEDRVTTIVVCTEEEWQTQQALTPMENISLATLCAFRGDLETDTCIRADAEKYVHDALMSEGTTTVAPEPEAGAVDNSPARRQTQSSRGAVPRQTTLPQYTPPQYTPAPTTTPAYTTLPPMPRPPYYPYPN